VGKGVTVCFLIKKNFDRVIGKIKRGPFLWTQCRYSVHRPTCIQDEHRWTMDMDIFMDIRGKSVDGYGWMNNFISAARLVIASCMG